MLLQIRFTYSTSIILASFLTAYNLVIASSCVFPTFAQSKGSTEPTGLAIRIDRSAEAPSFLRIEGLLECLVFFCF